MISIRSSADRGRSRHGRLISRQIFSVAGYRDPAHVEYGPLLVINEVRVAGGRGFPAHRHDDKEISSNVPEGAFRRGNSLGNGSNIRPGESQLTSARTGVGHGEPNASGTDSVHFPRFVRDIFDVNGVVPLQGDGLRTEADSKPTIAGRGGSDEFLAFEMG